MSSGNSALQQRSLQQAHTCKWLVKLTSVNCAHTTQADVPGWLHVRDAQITNHQSNKCTDIIRDDALIAAWIAITCST